MLSCLLLWLTLVAVTPPALAQTTPALGVRLLDAGRMELHWPLSATNFALHVAESLTAPAWAPWPHPPLLQPGERILAIESQEGARFYRLQPTTVPGALDDTAVTKPGIAVIIPVLANDSDPLGGVLLVVAWNQPQNGTVTFAAGSATYTPAPGFEGRDSFAYWVQNTTGGTATATVFIDVQDAVDLPPVITEVSPESGVVGTEVTLGGNGFGFDPSTTVVRFGGTVAAITEIGPTFIRTHVPPGAVTGPLSVTTPYGDGRFSRDFAVARGRDFLLATQPFEGALLRGSSTTFHITATSLAGAADRISLQVNGLPAGVTATFTPPTVAAGQPATLTLLATLEATLGTAAFTITGRAQIEGAPVTHEAPASITISAGGRTELRGRIRLVNGPPIIGAQFVIQGQTNMSDAAGNFHFADLAPGKGMLSINATTAHPKYPIYGLDVLLVEGATLLLEPFQICPPPPPERFTALENRLQDQIVSDERFPGATITVPAGVTIIGWDGTPKTQIAIERLTPDQLPVPPPPFPTRALYQPMFGTPMGGLPSKPLPVTTPNDLNLLPGQKAEIWYYEAAPIVGVQAKWVRAGLGTVSDDGLTVVSDPGVGIQRFCGVCGLWCITAVQAGQPTSNPDPATPLVADPVDLSLGQLMVDKTDLVLPGRFPAVIHRRYNPYEPFGGTAGFELGFGPGWSLSVEIVLQEESDMLRRLVLPGNARYAFLRQTDSSFVNTSSPQFAGAVLTHTANGFHELRFREGTTWTFQTSPRLPGIGVLIEQADPNGNRLTLERDAQSGRLKRLVEPTGRALEFLLAANGRIQAITDPIGRTVHYGYNAAGRLETVTDAAGGVTRYTYGDAGRILDITDPRGITYIRNDYGPDGRIIRQTQADGGVWLFAYEGAPGLTTETVVTDPRGYQTSYRLSPAGTVTETTDPLGARTRLERNAKDQIVSVTDALGRATRMEYDGAGNVTLLTDSAGREHRIEYDPVFNRPLMLTDPLGNVTTLEYDGRGNLLATIDPLQNLRPAAERLKTRMAYNEFGQPVSVTDLLGNVLTFHYDHWGNLARITDPLGHSAHRAYDLVSRLTAQTDALGRTTRFTYDALNRLVELVDASGGVTQFAHDPNGNLLRLTDPLGHTTLWEYDPMDRVSVRVDPLGARETFVHDPLGNLREHRDRKGQLSTYRHDSVGRLLGATFADAATAFVYDVVGRLVEATDSAGGTVLLAYDGLDRLLRETTALGTVEYGYDELDRRISMQAPGQAAVRYHYDANSRLTRIVQGAQTVDFAHDALGRRTRLTLPNGVSTEYAYDGASRLVELIYRNAAGPLGNLTYRHNANGSRTGLDGTFARLLLPEPVAGADCDAANRQLIFGGRTLEFDGNGNLTALRDGPDTSRFTWDARNRLTALNSPEVTAAFTYDPFGRRAAKEINGRLTRYGYDGADIALEVGLSAKGLLFSGNVDEPLVRDGSEHYLADGLGTVLALTDETGAVQTEYSYEPFGRTSVTGDSDNALQFTGRENDLTEIYFYRARYYSPTLHRFISQDSLGIAGGDMNLYAYVGGNPVNLTDPSGQIVPLLIGVAILADTLYTGYQVADDLVNGRKVDLLEAASLLPIGKPLKLLKAAKSGRKVLVIGEDMQRVGPYAQKIGAEIYPGMPGYKAGMEAQALAHNQAFVQQKIADGYRIIDIGPDFPRRAIRGHAQPGYEMERTITKGYQGYEKAFIRTSKNSLILPPH